MMRGNGQKMQFFGYYLAACEPPDKYHVAKQTCGYVLSRWSGNMGGVHVTGH